MKKLFIVIIVPILFFGNLNAQKRQKPKSEYQNKIDTLRKKLSGVKYAKLFVTEEERDVFSQNEKVGANTGSYQVMLGLKNFIVEDLGLGFVLSYEQENFALQNTSSFCDFVIVSYTVGSFKQKFVAVGSYDVELNFIFCDLKDNIFKTTVNVDGNTIISSKFKRAFSTIITKEWEYDVSNRLSVNHNPVVLSFDNFTQYLDSSKNLEKYEGVYELFDSDYPLSMRTRIGIIYKNGIYKVLNFKSTNSVYRDDWLDGELKGEMVKTKSEGVFFTDWYNIFKTPLRGTIKFSDNNNFVFKLDSDKYTDNYIRIK